VTADASGAADGAPTRRLFGLVELRRGEAAPVALAALYSFCLMASYNFIKPYREALGTTVPDLSKLWYSTLIACTVVLIPYWALVGRMPRQRFIPWVHRFFEVAFVVLFLLLRDEHEGHTPGIRAAAISFYAGVSAFNLLVLSQFWGFMADVFTRDQGQRLFAWIAAGGTAGGLLSSIATKWTQDHALLEPPSLIWPAIVLLEAATFAALRLSARVPPSEWRPTPRSGLLDRLADVGEGARLFVRSPYLLAIAGFMFASLFTSAFVYDFQRILVRETIHDRAAQTSWYALNNNWQQVVALIGQVAVSSRLISTAGLGVTLALLPLSGVAALATFALAPTLEVIKWAQIAFKGVDYALAKPAREALFTVVSRTEKYQSKSLIDAGLYRAFDAFDSSIVTALRDAKVAAPAMAWIAAPVAALGLPLAWLLSRMQRRRHLVLAPARPVEEVDPIAEA
jgi:AAA family ATP:ADP antiporter